MIEARRNDQGLINEVQEFLKDDIPSHFSYNTPIFYFSRYLATPDYETLFYIEQVKKYNYPIVIGRTRGDKLTSHSSLKRNLVKLPIVVGESKSGEGIIQYERVADLNAEQGKAIEDVELLNGGSLFHMHRYLTEKLFPKNVLIVDESRWVNRHSRGELVSLYENMLALLIVHGIMLEYYEFDELDFLEDTVIPAMEKTEQRFGCKPLLAPLQQKQANKIKDFNSYPKTVKDYVDEYLKNQTV